MRIPFNKPYLAGREKEYVLAAIDSGFTKGNGPFARKCHELLERRYGFGKCLLTTSCTDALEMAAILTGVGPGDEVIVPSYTFVSSALAFARQGATIVFADSESATPNIDAAKIESLVTPRTRVIVPVHYAGMACNMDAIMAIAKRHDLLVVEDAAQAVDSFYQTKAKVEDEQRNVVNSAVRLNPSPSCRALGSIGHFGCFSFHETKGVYSGEGGVLAVNDERFLRRAEIVWEKGTNRMELVRGEVNKYGWVDVGSSFLPSEMIAAFLYGQLERIDEIQAMRVAAWNAYRAALAPLAGRGLFEIQGIPSYATNNAHMFYLKFRDHALRERFAADMKTRGIGVSAHYLCLHDSKYAKDRGWAAQSPEAERWAETIVRLPLFPGVDAATVAGEIADWCESAAQIGDVDIGA